MTIDELLQAAARLQQAGDVARAEQVYREILSRDPNHAGALHDFGVMAFQIGRADVAAQLMERSVAADPRNAERWTNLAHVYHALGREGDAIATARRAIEVDPKYAEAYMQLGVALYAGGEIPGAVDAWRESTRLKPSAVTLSNLAAGLSDLQRTKEGIAAAKEALRLDPNAGDARQNLGTLYRDGGRIDEAIAEYRRAAEAKFPGAMKANSALLHLLCHAPGIDNSKLHYEHLKWADRYARDLEGAATKVFSNDRAPDRRLRVGYVSPHFYNQSVFAFLEPLLKHHDKARVELFCYSDVKREDDATQRARSYADHWRDARGVSNEALDQQIRQDRIDVLIDMTGHLADNRLLVFARKPAPVQVTYIGYQHTTGLRTLDYRLTDSWCDPDGWEKFYTEKLVRLPKRFFCYLPPQEYPPVVDPPCLRSGHITFGYFNHLAKLNPQVVDLFCRVLKKIPTSRLLLLCPSAGDEFAKPFTKRGIDANRIDIERRRTPIEYLKLFDRVDIALDPFPFSGHTTTCDTLWMGVPVVTLLGQTFAGRMSFSVLKNLDLDEMIADSKDKYVAKIEKLAANPDRLRELRHSMRDRMKSSPILDGPDFARVVEVAYFEMWRNWLAASSA